MRNSLTDYYYACTSENKFIHFTTINLLFFFCDDSGTTFPIASSFALIFAAFDLKCITITCIRYIISNIVNKFCFCVCRQRTTRIVSRAKISDGDRPVVEPSEQHRDRSVRWFIDAKTALVVREPFIEIQQRYFSR